MAAKKKASAPLNYSQADVDVFHEEQEKRTAEMGALIETLLHQRDDAIRVAHEQNERANRFTSMYYAACEDRDLHESQKDALMRSLVLLSAESKADSTAAAHQRHFQNVRRQKEEYAYSPEKIKALIPAYKEPVVDDDAYEGEE